MLSLPSRDLVLLALRRSAQGPGFAAARVGYSVAVFVPVALAPLVQITSEVEYAIVGRTLFWVQAALAGFVAAVVVPAMVAQSLGEDVDGRIRESGNEQRRRAPP